jgi:hypothetical protein
MISDLDSLLYQAEVTYLGKQDLANFKSQIFSLEKRLQTYELLSAKETEIFQYLANQLINDFPTEDEAKIERALKHWLTVFRYCAMAMLADNHLYLQHHILEWLPEQITAHQLQVLEKSLFDLLQKRLQKIFTSEQFSILQPFLQQSQNALFK